MNNHYDYIVIGAGISGLSSAYHLSKDGYRVLVLEAEDGKNSASFASTAEMNHDPDVEWQQIIVQYGLEGARALWTLFGNTLDTLSEFAHQVGEEHFRTERVPAYLYARTEEGIRKLEGKYQQYKDIGANVSLDVTARPDLHPAFKAVLTIHGDGVTNNQHLIASLRHMILEQGGIIVNHKKVNSIQDTLVSTADGDTYLGDSIIVATGDGSGLVQLPEKVKRTVTFVVSFERHNIPDVFRNAVMWDTDEPYHYTRSFAGNRIWVGGEDVGEEEYNETPESNQKKYDALAMYAKEVLGIDESYAIQATWKGTFFTSARGLPYIGEVEGTKLLASVGFGGSGIITSFLSGFLIASWNRGELLEYKKYFTVN